MYLKMRTKKTLLVSVVSILLISACSTDMNSGRANFSIPALSGDKWQAKGYPFEDADVAYCVVEGGGNNIRLILEMKRGQQEANPFIESTRLMKPGTILSINSSNNSFKVYDKVLSAKRSRAIVQDIEAGQTVYLRWSEPHGGDGRINYTNRIEPEDFSAPYQKCITFINQQMEVSNEGN